MSNKKLTKYKELLKKSLAFNNFNNNLINILNMDAERFFIMKSSYETFNYDFVLYDKKEYFNSVSVKIQLDFDKSPSSISLTFNLNKEIEDFSKIECFKNDFFNECLNQKHIVSFQEADFSDTKFQITEKTKFSKNELEQQILLNKKIHYSKLCNTFKIETTFNYKFDKKTKFELNNSLLRFEKDFMYEVFNCSIKLNKKYNLKNDDIDFIIKFFNCLKYFNKSFPKSPFDNGRGLNYRSLSTNKIFDFLEEHILVDDNGNPLMDIKEYFLLNFKV